jgi:bifunctional DNA-binding transcriptional regulator/antitoxin component of YhaV-PrlF toxin-antitoxin module
MPGSTRTLTVDDTGQIAISEEAREQLGLVAGAQVVETIVDGMLIYVPLDATVERTIEVFRQRLAERGVTAADILAEIERGKDEVFAALYPTLVPR